VLIKPVRRSRSAVILTVILFAAATGCGGTSTGGKRAKERAGALKAYRVCESQVGPLLTALEQLHSRLDIGLTFQEYSNRLGDKVAYDAAPFEQQSAACTSRVGVPAEAALNAYIRAYNTWNDCISDLNCSTDSINSQLQGPWATAASKLDRARAGLEAIKAGPA
jgi:hypothetical protein